MSTGKQNQLIDLTDKYFGEWHVIRYLGKGSWECQCSCGKVKSVSGADLRKGKSTSCGHTRKADHTGEIVDGYEIVRYAGDYKWECKCLECGEIHIVHTYFIEHNSLPKCLHGGMDPRLIDITNKTFGEWHVDSYDKDKLWNCSCSCGKKQKIRGRDLRSGATKSCGHAQKGIEGLLNSTNEFIDLKDKTFGEWYVIEYAGKGKWRCKCSCGVIHEVRSPELRNGTSKSCGHSVNKLKDITNKVFGELTAKEYIGNGIWRCECSCGSILNVNGYLLRSGKQTSCNASIHRYIDLKGEKVGELTVLEYVGNNSWLCECSCGTKITVFGVNLRNRTTLSCGCKTYELRSKTLVKSGRLDRTDEQITATSNEQNLRKYIKYKHESNLITLEELAEDVGLTYASTIRLVNRLGIKDIIKQKSSSKQEDEIYEFIKSLYSGYIEKRNRSILNGTELDLYIPEKKVAIEYNGSYWHSDLYKDKYYHRDKTTECAKHGIRLIHIFEYEWNDSIQKLKLLNILSEVIVGYNNVVYGRNTDIKHISTKESNEFLDKYHLQGKCEASIRYGCYTPDNELLGVLTIGKSRFDSEYQYEIVRTCWKDGTTVVGGFQKLFNRFIREYNPLSVITYSDISKFTGNSYTKAGFKVGTPIFSEPGYVWILANTQSKVVLTRYQTQKHRLVKMGLGNENQTETEIMEYNNYFKVYNCGNIRLEWKAEVR